MANVGKYTSAMDRMSMLNMESQVLRTLNFLAEYSEYHEWRFQ